MTVSKAVSRNISRDVSHVITGGDLLSQVISLVSTRNGLLLTNTISSFFQDVAGTVPATAGDPVGHWADAANDYDLTQSTALARPTLQQDGSGKYYLQFDGLDDTLTGLPDILTRPNTIVVAFTADALGANLLSGVGPNRHNMAVSGGGNPQLFAGTLMTDTGTVLTTGTRYTMTGVYNGASSAIRINGTQTYTGNSGTENLSNLRLARGDSVFSQVKLYGVCVVNSNLSASDLALVESYMSSLGS